MNLPIPTPVRADIGMTVTPGIPSSVSSRRRSDKTLTKVVRGKQVHLVEDDHRDGRVSRQRPQIALMEDGIGVLLRVEDPDEQVDHLHQPVHLSAMRLLGRVVVWQVQQHQAVERVVLARVENALLGNSVPQRNAQPFEQWCDALCAPDARQWLASSGPPNPYACQLDARDRVEDRRLAAAGGAGERNNGVVRGQTAALTRPLDDRAHPLQQVGWQSTLAVLDGSRQRVEAFRKPGPGRSAQQLHRSASCLRACPTQTSDSRSACPAPGSRPSLSTRSVNRSRSGANNA